MITRMLIFLACALIASPAQAQEEPVSFSVPAAETSPLPMELVADPTLFHAEAVALDGRLRLSFTDLSIAARGWPLTFARSYLDGVAAGSLGPGWATSIDVAYQRSRDTGTVFIREADGGESAYQPLAGNVFRGVSGRINARLVEGPDVLTRIYADGSREIFGLDGFLIRRAGADGNGYDLVRNGENQVVGFAHDDGQIVDIEWAGARVSSIRDELGRGIDFEYSQGRLALTRDVLGRVTTFAYDDTGRLTGVELVSGATVAVEYDVNGRVRAMDGPGTLKTKFDHWGAVEDNRLVQTSVGATGLTYRAELILSSEHPDDFSLELTDPGGEVTVHDQRGAQLDVSRNGIWLGAVLHDRAGEARAHIRPDGLALLPDAQGDGIVPQDAPDDRGNPQIVVDASGRTAWRSYDIAGRTIAGAGHDGRPEYFEYDLGNRLRSFTSADRTRFEYSYDAADRLVGWTASDGTGGSYAYNGLGQVLRISQTGYADQTFAYDAAGRITAVNDGERDFTASYDASGRPTGLWSEDGRGFGIAYDAAGRLAAVVNEAGLSVEFATDGTRLFEDSVGRIRGAIENEDGSLTILEPQGAQTIVEVLDGGDSLVTQVDREGYGWVERRDPNGILLAGESRGEPPYVFETDEDGMPSFAGDPLLPSNFEFDDRGLLARTVDSIGVVSEFEHDARGRLVRAASPYHAVEFRYDGESDAPSGIVTSDGLEVRQTFDERGRPVRFDYSDELGVTSWEELVWDDRDRIVLRFDGTTRERLDYPNEETTVYSRETDGRVLTWTETYDPVARTKTTDLPDGTRMVATLNEAGHLVGYDTPLQSARMEVDPDGIILSISANGLSRTFAEETGDWVLESTEDFDQDEDGVASIDRFRDGRGGLWTIGYDYRGFVMRLTDPVGGTTTVDYDATGQITRLTDPEGRVHYALFDDLGREIESGVVGGWAKATEWDRNDPVASSNSAGNRFYVDSPEQGRVVAHIDGEAESEFGIDRLGRVATATNSAGQVSVAFSDGGQISSVRDVFGREVSYEYDSLGRRSAIVLPEGDTIALTYSGGNSIAQTGPDGGETRTTWTRERAGYDIDLAEGATVRLDVDDGFALVRLEVQGNESRVLEIDRQSDGHVTATRSDGATTRYSYDALGRLSSVKGGTGAERTWSYDGSDNILGENDGPQRRYDKAYRLTENGSETGGYDQAGRMTSLGPLDLEYRTDGRLRRAGEVEFVYDAAGRMVERRGPQGREQYLYDGRLLLAVYDGDTGDRLALLERSAAMPQMLRLHTGGSVRTLLPDHLGTPRLSVSGTGADWLAPYGPWGAAPADLPGFARWVGFSGHMQAPGVGLILMQSRAYMLAIQRFTSPDPLGIGNPVNPYAYANLNPVSFVDMLGSNAQLPNLSPAELTPKVLPSGFNPDPDLFDNSPRNRRLMNEIMDDLRSIMMNRNNTPAARRVAAETMAVLRNKGVTTHFNTTMSGYGSATTRGGRGYIDINPDLAPRLNPRNWLGGNPRRGVVHPMQRSTRALTRVVGHEAGHILQGLLQQGSNKPVGRALRETLSMLREDVLGRAHGGDPPGRSIRSSVRESLRYGLRTQYSAHMTGATRIPSSYGRFAGMQQLSPEMVVEAVQRYHPHLRPHDILEDFRRAHADILSEGDDFGRDLRRLLAREPGLRGLVREQMTHARDLQRRPATDLTRPASADANRSSRARSSTRRASRASSAPTRRLPRVAPETRPVMGDPPKTSPRANSAARPAQGSGTARPNRPLRNTRPAAQPPHQPRATAPRATTPKPTAESGTRRPIRQGAITRRVASRPPTQRLTSVPHTTARPSTSPQSGGTRRIRSIPHTVERPPSRQRPPATRANPHPRNPRPPATTGAGRPRPASTAPEPPRVRPAPPEPSTNSPRRLPRNARAPRPAVETPRPPRPGAHGGRYPIPDLTSGRPASPPPRTLANGGRPSSSAPHQPQGHTGGLRSHPRVRIAMRTGFILVDAAFMAYDTYEFLEGRRTEGQYIQSMALNTAMIVLPHPISTAIMAHQMGSFLGSYAASKLLEAYYNGDPVARALINWMRRNDWINANDPTFVAVGEAVPPSLTEDAWSITAGSAVAVPVSFWAMEPDEVTIRLRRKDSAEVAAPLVMSARPGLNSALITEVLIRTLAAGEYFVTVEDSGGRSETALSLDVQQPADPSSPGPVDEQAEMSVEVEIRETRLDPTDLPWERFDRPDTLLSPDSGAPDWFLGDWVWSEDKTTGWQSHERGPGPGSVHYALLGAPAELIRGDNIVQYLWIDPADAPDQIVLQIYDDVLDARHRISFGKDVLAIDGRDDFGLIESGALPPAGAWMRLRLPVTDIGMDGRSMRGIGFLSDKGRVVWGPTRLSGADDVSPMLSRIEDRDRSGAPQSDLIVRLGQLAAGDLTVTLVSRDGGEIEVFDGRVDGGVRQYWWQGDAKLLQEAQVRVVSRSRQNGTVAEVTAPVPGNPAIVARILYPPYGAVVRQTVPVFGQAGGAGFDNFIVEYRTAGSGDQGWKELARSATPSLVIDAGIRDRIDQIMKRELRSTIHGNLASLHTGSALHSFEFSDADPVLPSGWIDIRLITRDANGNARQDFTSVIVGEVATGQVRSDIASLDGRAVLSVPPLSMPAGMGVVSLVVSDRPLPAGAPAPSSRLYEIAPSGLHLHAPLRLAIEAPDSRTIVAVDDAGHVTPLATDSADGIVRARLRQSGPRAAFYATAEEFPPNAPRVRRDPAPWFDTGGDEPALIANMSAPGAAKLDLPEPISLKDPLGVLLSLTPHAVGSTGIVLRFDGDARLVPLRALPAGLDRSLAADGLGIADGSEPVSVFLPLAAYLPPTAQGLEVVELMSIDAAAWRTYLGRPARRDEVELHTLAVGRLPGPGPVSAWTSPEDWAPENGTISPPTQPIRFETDGFHPVSIGGVGPLWPVLIDRTPPEIRNLQPEDGRESDALVVTAELADPGSGIAPETIALTINDAPVPRHLLTFNQQTGRLEASIGDLREARILNGGLVSARLSVSDRLGQKSAVSEWQWRHRSKAIAVGNLTQLTVDGGASPVWEPDGATFVYAGFVDGQAELLRGAVDARAPERLTTDPGVETDPVVSPEGRIAYLADGQLRLLGGEAPEIGDLKGLAWHDAETLLAGQGNRLLKIGLDGTVAPVCEIATGAEISDPRPIGRNVLFVQQLYHRTIWLCDPETGTARPLSEGINQAATRDVDPDAMDADRYIYARDDGRGGLWQRRIEDPRSTQVLAAAGGSDRRPAVAPDGLSLLFDSDRSGRREIWRLAFAEAPRFEVAAQVVTGRADEGIEVIVGTLGDGQTLSVTTPDGDVIDAAPRIAETGRGVLLQASSDWPEGELQLTLTLAGRGTVSVPLLVDRTPPEIVVSRISDGLNLSEIEEIRPLDSFRVDVADAGTITELSASDAAIASGRAFRVADLGDSVLTIAARDAAGNSSSAQVDLTPGAASKPRIGPVPAAVVTKPEPLSVPEPVEDTPDEVDDQPGPAGAFYVILLALALVAVGAVAWQRYGRRR